MHSDFKCDGQKGIIRKSPLNPRAIVYQGLQLAQVLYLLLY